MRAKDAIDARITAFRNRRGKVPEGKSRNGEPVPLLAMGGKRNGACVSDGLVWSIVGRAVGRSESNASAPRICPAPVPNSAVATAGEPGANQAPVPPLRDFPARMRSDSGHVSATGLRARDRRRCESEPWTISAFVHTPLPCAPNVHIECPKHTIQVRVPMVSIASVVQDEPSLKLVGQMIVSLALTDPLRDLHC